MGDLSRIEIGELAACVLRQIWRHLQILELASHRLVDVRGIVIHGTRHLGLVSAGHRKAPCALWAVFRSGSLKGACIFRLFVDAKVPQVFDQIVWVLLR